MSTGVDLSPGTAGSPPSGDNGAPPVLDNGGNPGSGAPGVPVNGSPGTPPGSAADQPFWSGLKDDGLKSWAEGKKWTDVEAALKSHKELEVAFSSRVPANVPKSADEYGLNKPDGLPDGFDYNIEFAKNFQKWAFDSKLSVEAAKAIHDNFVNFALESHKGAMANMSKELEANLAKAETALKQSWGETNTPKFQRSLELARRAMDQLGIGDDLKAMGAVVKDATGAEKIANAKVFDALAKVGQAMYAEDTLFGKIASNVNPFDPKTEDVQMQGRIFKDDPQRAKLLIMSLPREIQERYSFLLSKIG